MKYNEIQQNTKKSKQNTKKYKTTQHHLQQWDILEDRNQESENIRCKMLEDLMLFTNTYS